MSAWRGGRDGPSTDDPEMPLTGTPRREPADPAAGPTAGIGPSISLRGELSGAEDLIFDGKIEGNIDLSNHRLTIGPHGQVRADLVAREVSILGRVLGNVTASERVEIGASGRLEGNVTAPRLSMVDGGHLNGKVKTRPTGASPEKGASSRPPAGPSGRPATA